MTTNTTTRTRTEVKVGEVAFHAVNRETGTLVIVERTGAGHWLVPEFDGWLVICDKHNGHDVFHAKWEAVLDARTPSLFCEGCAAQISADAQV